eukprot:4731111-Amphidinium_carterae.1
MEAHAGYPVPIIATAMSTVSHPTCIDKWYRNLSFLSLGVIPRSCENHSLKRSKRGLTSARQSVREPPHHALTSDRPGVHRLGGVNLSLVQSTSFATCDLSNYRTNFLHMVRWSSNQQRFSFKGFKYMKSAQAT